MWGDHSHIRCLCRLCSHSELDAVHQESDGVEHPSDKLDCLGADAGEENERHHHDERRETRCAHYGLDALHAEESVVAAGVIDLVAHEWGEKLGQGDRAPNHRHRQAEKPFPQVHPIGTHQPQADHCQEYGNQQCGQSKTYRHQPVGHQGASRSTSVGKSPLHIHPFAGSEVFDQTLVCGSGIEIAHHRYDEEDGQGHDQHADDKIGLFAAQYVGPFGGLGLASGLSGVGRLLACLRLRCHCCVMSYPFLLMLICLGLFVEQIDCKNSAKKSESHTFLPFSCTIPLIFCCPSMPRVAPMSQPVVADARRKCHLYGS